MVHWDGVHPWTCRWPATPAVPWWPRFAPMTGTPAIRAATGLLGAGCVVWSAVPLVHTGHAGFALFLAIWGWPGGAAADPGWGPGPRDNYLLSGPLRAWLRFLEVLRRVPWEEGALIAVLWLEVAHPARPWHYGGPGRRADRLPAGHPPGRIRRLPRAFAAAGPGAGRGRGPARASARAPGCCPRPDRARVRHCCGWWRRARSSRPAPWCCPTWPRAIAPSARGRCARSRPGSSGREGRRGEGGGGGDRSRGACRDLQRAGPGPGSSLGGGR